MGASGDFTALLLAGRRDAEDPLARAEGVRHRALVPVAGVPMLGRVLQALAGAPGVRRVAVVSEDPALCEGVPDIAALRARTPVVDVAAAASPAASVLACLGRGDADPPALVTTADHPLLTAERIEHFLEAARRSRADVVAGLVPAAGVRARFPDSRRTWIRFGRERYAGANLFVFLTPEARRAADFWRRAEHLRKRPLRLAALFGAGTLLRLALGRLEPEAAFARASRVMGVRAEPVVLDEPEYAIDVDRAADLALVRRLLESDGT